MHDETTVVVRDCCPALTCVCTIQTGGNDPDGCEDVAGGLKAVLELPWTAHIRILVHIGPNHSASDSLHRLIMMPYQ